MLTLLLQYAVPIAWIGTAASFLFGFIKWYDQRRREQEQIAHEAFHKMICLASGKAEDGRVISMTQQIAAIYQLQSYKKYSFAAIPVLQLMQFEFSKQKGADERDPHMQKALQDTVKQLTA